MAKKKRIAALSEPVRTDRFDLVPLSRLEAWRLRRQVDADAEVLGLLELRQTDPGAWRTWRRLRRPNGRTRFYHGIVARQTGATIGAHWTFLVPYRTATWGVAILDRQWWGKGVVVEIRKALIATLVRHAAIEQFTGSVHARNHASMLNYHKLGFEHTGVHYSARHDELRDEAADFVSFSLRGEKLARQLEQWHHEPD